MNRERIETLVRDPLNPVNGETAARVYVDESLWPTVEEALYPNAEPTEEERRAIRRVVAERCGDSAARRQKALNAFVAGRLERISSGMGDFALAAARRDGGEAGDAVRDDGDPVTFVFVSDSAPAGSGALAWRACLTLPPGAEVDTMLSVAVTDGRGEPMASGVFRVAGVALPVRRGSAEIPYGMFLSGLKEAQVEFTDASGVRTPGTLALF